METPAQEAVQQDKTDPRQPVVAEVKADAQVVEEKVAAVAESVTSEVKEVVARVVNVAEKSVIAITTEEKLAIREIENKFLKTQMEITRLQSVAQEVQKSFPSMVEQLKQKYVVDPATYLFDSAKLEFRRK